MDNISTFDSLTVGQRIQFTDNIRAGFLKIQTKDVYAKIVSIDDVYIEFDLEGTPERYDEMGKPMVIRNISNEAGTIYGGIVTIGVLKKIAKIVE